MADIKRQFLDYAGLQQFWGIIDGKFANKVDAVKVDSFAFNTTDASVTMTYTDSAATPKTYNIPIPMATDENAGMLSASDKALIDDIDNKINDMAPFHGLKIDGNEVNLVGKRANIGLDFVTTGDVADGTRKAYIDLVDLGWPADAQGNPYSWSVVEESEYNANAAADVAYYAFNNKYYKWGQSGVEGPKNNVGEPLMQKPVSRIDVSELVKAGLLQDADVVVSGSGDNAEMFLKLTFIIGDDGSTKDVMINVSDLVDIYKEGEGIEITQGALSADGKEQDGSDAGSPRESTIKLRVATDTTLGGIKTGYTTDAVKQLYKVQVDANGNGFVAVPWENVTVNVTSTGKNASDQQYLIVTPTISNSADDVDANGVPQHSYSFNIEVGEGIKTAEAYAGTSVQSVEPVKGAGDADNLYIVTNTVQKTNVDGDQNLGKEVTLDLTASAKGSLALADAAVQYVVTDNVDRKALIGEEDQQPTTGDDLVVSLVAADGTEYDGEKGEKTIKITLGQKTTSSLKSADTAIQSINMMGTTLNKLDNTYTAAQATQAMSLGSAANVNTADAIPGDGHGKVVTADAEFQSDVKTADGTMEPRDYVATAKAVKAYVDDQNDKYYETITDETDGKISALTTYDEPTTGQKPHIVNDTVGAAYDYTNNKYAGEEGANGSSKTILTQIGQTAGILDSGKTLTAAIGIQDIYDFAPLSKNDINAICGIAN